MVKNLNLELNTHYCLLIFKICFMPNVYNELIAQLNLTGLSAEFSNKIADCLSQDITDINQDYFRDVLTGRIKKVKKAIQATLIKVN